MWNRTIQLTALLTLCALTGSATAGNGKIVIKCGRVITQAGPDIENGVIVIEEGRIVSIGKDVKTAWDAEVLDHPELVAFPGFVEAHSIRGMDRPNENIEIAPFLDVRDSIDPINFYFEDVLRQGITTINVQQGPMCVIGGQGRVVKPVGLTVDEMTVRSSIGLKIVAGARPGRSRATQAQALRKAFGDLQMYLEKLVQDKKDGKDYARREALFQGRDMDKDENKTGREMEGVAPWKVADFKIVPRGEVDDKQEPLLRLVEGKLMAFVYCDSGVAVNNALAMARAHGFLANTVLVLDGDAWKAADAIAEAGVPVVLGPAQMYVERDPITGKEIETFVPRVFFDKKIRFALQSLNSTAQSLWFQAAQCIGQGIDRKAALDAVTRTPAEILRLGKRVGALEAGKDGNVVLFNGDPISVKSTVQYVVIEGNLVYDRSKDSRARQLLQGIEQANAAPEAVEEAVDPHSGKKAAEEKKSGSEKKD
ncbi:MAG: amidohydrolase family protein [Planctomycetes bacterium]|nr:amidohydrolase family protein [Planctomycetota bacterium]